MRARATKSLRSPILNLIIILAAAASGFWSCEENKLPTEPESTLSITEDAAESVSSGLGYENGGLNEQIADMFALASRDSLVSVVKMTASVTDTTIIDTIYYSAVTRAWTVSLTRIHRRVTFDYTYTARVKRKYEYQYLNVNGDPLQFWSGKADTVRSMRFRTISGTGTHLTRRLAQNLTSVTGDWTILNTVGDTIAITGTYTRAGRDTVKTRNAVRILDHSFAATSVSVKCPRVSSASLWQSVTGTIAGTYSVASVTFSKGTAYKEKSLTAAAAITLNGNGKGAITINGKSYTADLNSGEMSNP